MHRIRAALYGAIAITALALSVVPATPAAGAEIASMSSGATAMVWQPSIAYERMVLTVSGPYGAFSQEFGSATMPSLDLYDAEGHPLADGSYKWELRAQPAISSIARAAMAEARETGDYSKIDALRSSGEIPSEPMVASGSFRVANGTFVDKNVQEDADVTGGPANTSAGATVRSTSAAATVLANNDGVIRQSLCVGIDCPNSPSFGFDTIRIQENNTRFHFDDTSNSGSFPSNDWRLVANDSNNGGRNVFYIEDSTAGTQVVSVEAGAGNNALYVDDAGQVGLGTSTPVVELHVVDGDSPTLRLEQDGSSGFTPQIWDVAGNEANFFVRDVTHGSALPFRIRPGVANQFFNIGDGSGNERVGIGTANPDATLHVHRTDGTANLLVEEASSTAVGRVLYTISNNGAARFDIIDTSQSRTWRFANGGGNFSILDTADPGNVEFLLTPAGDLTIQGSIFTGGTMCGSGCDLVFDPEFDLDPIEEHAELMWENRHLPAVGPTEENGRWNLSEKTGGILHELEVAHIYIEQLNERLTVKERENAELEARLAALEQLVQTLAQ